MTTSTINLDLQRTLRLIPGYDPFATAGDAWFDEDAALMALEFFPECLKHIEGVMAGEPFVLEPWQQAIIGNLFGWKRRIGNKVVRRYRECLIFIPRKAGKTPIAAGVGIYHLFCDPERGQQNYIAASTKEQAGLLFRHCKGMVEQEDELSSRCRIYGGNAPAGQSQSIVVGNSFLKVISGDVKTGAHGKNTNLAIVDELHEQPDRELTDTLRTSMASANKPQPLLIYTTTSDYDRPNSICNEIHDYASKVRDGLIENTAFLPVIYEASIDDDWTDPAVWAAANPNLGVSVSEEYMRTECQRAKDSPAYENTFKRLHLNIRTEQDVRWLQMEHWDACTQLTSDQIADECAGQPCWCGLDLSTTTDISAFALVFKTDTGYRTLLRFWVPEDGARKREKRDRVPYQKWIKDGTITATPGETVDYDVLRRDINQLGERYDIREIAADRWNASQLITQLDGDGFTIFAHGQGYASMSAPSKDLEKCVIAHQLDHGGNPVLRWMASNVSVEIDAAGNIKPSKKKSTERIDGIVALVMGLGRAAVAGDGMSVYESRGFLTV